jgi:hypothetical protein
VNAWPFNQPIRVITDNGWTLINGEQITKVVMVRRAGESFITFHLSDGSTFEFDEDTSEEVIALIESKAERPT